MAEDWKKLELIYNDGEKKGDGSYPLTGEIVYCSSSDPRSAYALQTLLGNGASRGTQDQATLIISMEEGVTNAQTVLTIKDQMGNRLFHNPAGFWNLLFFSSPEYIDKEALDSLIKSLYHEKRKG